MIYVGTDIVEVDRIRNNLENNPVRFLNKVFTDKEVDYCNSKSDPAIHFSGRFAAKEAVKKALLSSGAISQISLSQIQIVSDNNIPKVEVLMSRSFSIRLSISHTDSFATSTAIFIKNESNA